MTTREEGMEKYIMFSRVSGGLYSFEFVEADNIDGVLAKAKSSEIFVANSGFVTRARAETVRTMTTVNIEEGPGPKNEAVVNPNKLAKAFNLEH